MSAQSLETCRQVIVQFSFSNPEAIPGQPRRALPETPKESSDRKSGTATGTMVIGPTEERASLAQFIAQLLSNGFRLVDAFTQQRVNKPGAYKKTYYMARYIFERDEVATALYGSTMQELQTICNTTVWRVRVFANPHGQLSVNLEARKPLFLPDGQPVVEWQKDAEGNRVGDNPIPIQPKHRLQVEDGTIVLS